MNDTDYVGEAAEALDAPGEIWLFRDDFSYDRTRREWLFHASNFQGLKFVGEFRDIILRICDWLQDRYPQGPAYSG